MSEHEEILCNLSASGKIELASSSSLSKMRLRYAFVQLLNLALHAILFFCFPKSILFTGFLVISLIATFFLLRKWVLNFSSAAIHGDCLVMKNVQNKNSVTQVKSVRSIRSKRIGRSIYTSMQYKLDGSLRKTILVTEEGTILPKVAIEAVQSSLKK